jgi:hypothetical protein
MQDLEFLDWRYDVGFKWIFGWTILKIYPLLAGFNPILDLKIQAL